MSGRLPLRARIGVSTFSTVFVMVIVYLVACLSTFMVQISAHPIPVGVPLKVDAVNEHRQPSRDQASYASPHAFAEFGARSRRRTVWFHHLPRTYFAAFAGLEQRPLVKRMRSKFNALIVRALNGVPEVSRLVH